ncbi:RNA polymerase sigma factor [candidate division FCPU426 bacterium]|nr:RNA polymerase sigma factor [candidate division FCPU426 bacterium]
MKTHTDLDLVRAYQKGDTQAGDTLYTRYYPKVLRLCRQYFSVWPDAEDTAQNVFLKVLAKKKICNYRGESQLWSWLYRVTANTCKADLRRRATKQQIITLYEEVAHAHEPASVPEHGFEKAVLANQKIRIINALWRLPARERQLVIAVYFMEKTYSETAEQAGVSVGTMGVRLMRAKAKLAGYFLVEQKNRRLPLADVFVMHYEKIYQAA